MIQDRKSWEAMRAEGLSRFVITRSVVLGLVGVISYVAPRWGKPQGVAWMSAFAWLVGGCLWGLAWGLIGWRMRDQAFKRDG